MNSDTLNFVLMIYLLGSFVLFAKERGPWMLFLIGSTVTVIGALAGIDFFDKGSKAGNASLSAYGQVIGVFASVVGGALVGAAISELRPKQ